MAIGQLESPSSPFTIEKRRVGPVLVVSVTGRLTEVFDGAELGRELNGLVVFDLERAKGITSYAVRSWVYMLAEAAPRITGLYFGRCSPAMSRQFSMVKNFAGDGQLLSFYAPYSCSHCSAEFEHLFDCVADADSIRRFETPAIACVRCGMDAELDDDPSSCFAFAAQQPDRPVPLEVQVALDAPAHSSGTDATSRARVEKSVQGEITRITVRAIVDKSLRWDRISEGLEGHVVFDMAAVPDVRADGSIAFEAMLRELGPEVQAVCIEACPLALLERIAVVPPIQRLTILSAWLSGHCRACALSRRALFDIRTATEAMRGGEPTVACDRCGAPINFLHSARPLRYLLAQPIPKLPSATTAVPRPPAGPGWSASTKLGAVLAGLAAILFAAVGIGLVVRRSRAEVPGASEQVLRSTQLARDVAAPGVVEPGVAANRAATADLPPAWSEQSLVLDGDNVLVVGTGGPASTDEGAVALARTDAIGRVAGGILVELSGTALYDHVQRCCGERALDPQVAERVAARYLSQVGTVATPERVDVSLRRDPEGITAFVRYRLAKTSLQQAAEIYRMASSFRGMTVAPYFPLIERTVHSEGGAVVVSVRAGGSAAAAGIQVGDFVHSVNGRRVYSVEDFMRITAAEWRKTPPLGRVSVEVESGGARRTTSFGKPMPPPRPPPPPPPLPSHR